MNMIPVHFLYVSKDRHYRKRRIRLHRIRRVHILICNVLKSNYTARACNIENKGRSINIMLYIELFSVSLGLVGSFLDLYQVMPN